MFQAIYLPKAIVETTGLKESERVLLRTTGNTVLIEILEALIKKKFASAEPGQVERGI